MTDQTKAAFDKANNFLVAKTRNYELFEGHALAARGIGGLLENVLHFAKVSDDIASMQRAANILKELDWAIAYVVATIDK